MSVYELHTPERTRRDEEPILISRGERDAILSAIGAGKKFHHISRLDETVNLIYSADIKKTKKQTYQLINTREWIEHHLRRNAEVRAGDLYYNNEKIFRDEDLKTIAETLYGEEYKKKISDKNFLLPEKNE
jgi:hypothetical protein